MKNKLTDLNNHLFAQLERLGDEGLTPAQIDAEVKRTKALVAVSAQIIDNASLTLQGAKLVAETGGAISRFLPIVENTMGATPRNVTPAIESKQ